MKHIAGTVVRSVVCQSAQVLLVQSKRLVDFHQWELPGGKLEEKESPYQTLQRELFEETNLVTQEAKLCIVWNRETPFDSYWRYIVYEVTAFTGLVQINDPEEIRAIGWFPLLSLPQLDEHTSSLIKNFPGKLPFKYNLAPMLCIGAFINLLFAGIFILEDSTQIDISSVKVLVIEIFKVRQGKMSAPQGYTPLRNCNFVRPIEIKL